MNPPNTPPAGASSPESDYETISEFVLRTETALTNGQLPDIAPLLAARGITAADMQARLAGAAKLRTLNAMQQKEYGEQYNATADYGTARKAAAEDFEDAKKLAGIVFRKDVAAQTALGLNERKARTQSGFVSQGELFYENALANAAYVAALATKGVTLADLQAGKAIFDKLSNLSAAQKKEMGEAQDATKVRDAAYEALDKWMDDFYVTARVALRKHGQLMEKLGIVVPS